MKLTFYIVYCVKILLSREYARAESANVNVAFNFELNSISHCFSELNYQFCVGLCRGVTISIFAFFFYSFMKNNGSFESCTQSNALKKKHPSYESFTDEMDSDELENILIRNDLGRIHPMNSGYSKSSVTHLCRGDGSLEIVLRIL